MGEAPWWRDYDFITAWGTLAAVVAALGIAIAPRVVGFWNRPVLALSFSNGGRHRRFAASGVDQTTGLLKAGLYYRLAVTNTGKSTARHVQARLVERVVADRPAEFFDPVNLHWVGTRSVRAEALVDIPPQQTEFVDVCVFRWVQRIGPEELRYPPRPKQGFTFDIYCQDSTPRGLATSLPPRGDILRVAVLAENASTVSAELRLPTEITDDPKLAWRRLTGGGDAAGGWSLPD